MRKTAIGPLLALLVLAAPLVGETSSRTETDHLIVEWVDGTPQEAIDAATAQGEKYYLALREVLGHEPPATKIPKVTILLQGPAERPDGTRGYPRVDSSGRIHLFQFGPTWHSYFSALAHEMVHVFRFRRQIYPDWFFEEGFAEFVALRVDPSLAGFPWYGFPLAVAAGQWIARGEGIPLTALRSNHRSINLPCKAQTYTLRSDFFDYLGRTHGDEVVLKMAAEERIGELAQYETFFGEGLATLEANWREDLLARYRSVEDADGQARHYRDSPIKYMHVCAAGREF
jgi:hypothetical protein